MTKEIQEGTLAGKECRYVESPAHQMGENGFEEFDSTFEHMEKGYTYKQELFKVECIEIRRSMKEYIFQ